MDEHEEQPLGRRGTTYHLVTDGIKAGLRLAKVAAGEQDVGIGGGVPAGRTYCTARHRRARHPEERSRLSRPNCSGHAAQIREQETDRRMK